MDKSDQINELVAALVKFQGSVSPVTMNREAKIFYQRDGKWMDKSYRYADLGAIFEAIRKPLSDAGLAISQFPSVEQNEVVVQTILFHTSGQFLKESIRMRPVDTKIQSIGSTITYGKRYSLSAILGISTEEDDDGGAGNGEPDPLDQRPPADRRPATTGRPAPQTAGNTPPSQDRRRPVRGRAQGQQQPPRTATPDLSALPAGVTKAEPAKDDLPWEPEQPAALQQSPEFEKKEGCIGQSEYDQIVMGLHTKKIKKLKWLAYIKENYKADSASDLTMEQFKEVFALIYSNPAVIDPGMTF